MLGIYDFFRNITDAANTQVAWLSNLVERNLDWTKLKCKRYNDILNAIDSSDMVREMITQLDCMKQRKTWATKKRGNLRQYNSEVPEILQDSIGIEKWMESTAIANQTSWDSGLAKRCLNCAYVKCLTKLNWKFNTNKWYTSSNFQEARRLLDIGCPPVKEEIKYKDIGLKSYRGLVMPLSYYPSLVNCNHTNRLCTISPSVPPANHDILFPPSSPDKSKMLPPPTPPTKWKTIEQDESTIGGFLMDFAFDGSEDWNSTPTKKEARTILLGHTAKWPAQSRQRPMRTPQVQSRQCYHRWGW